MPTNARAAICRGNQHPVAIEDVVLDDLKPDELRVRMVASGICHTDLAVRDAQLPVPHPIVPGHEGAGIVGAHPIIAVDVNDERLALANELGATHSFNAKDDAVDKMIGYFDFSDINEAIEASHNGSVVKPVLRIGPE